MKSGQPGQYLISTESGWVWTYIDTSETRMAEIREKLTPEEWKAVEIYIKSNLEADHD
jgi:hypothetical protein